MVEEADRKLNSHTRWAEVFSEHAQALAIRHLEAGGNLDPDDADRGLTVVRLKSGLREACPTEPLPSDDVIYMRISLLNALILERRLSEQLEQVQSVVADLKDQLAERVGEPLS